MWEEPQGATLWGRGSWVHRTSLWGYPQALKIPRIGTNPRGSTQGQGLPCGSSVSAVILAFALLESYCHDLLWPWLSQGHPSIVLVFQCELHHTPTPSNLPTFPYRSQSAGSVKGGTQPLGSRVPFTCGKGRSKQRDHKGTILTLFLLRQSIH